MKELVYIVMGIIVGGFGASFFSSSFSPPAESVEAKLEQRSLELRSARRAVAEYEQEYGKLDRDVSNQNMRAKARMIAQQLKNGEELKPDDVFHLMVPVLKDISPLLDISEELSLKNKKDALLMSYSRLYGLTKDQLASVEKHMDAKIEGSSKMFSDYFDNEGANFQDYSQLKPYDSLLDKELDSLMLQTLSEDKKEAFTNSRIDQKASKVNNEAYLNLRRLEQTVEMSEGQKDQAFGIFAQSSVYYDEGMEVETNVAIDNETYSPKERTQQIEALLDAEQRVKFQEYQMERRAILYNQDRKYNITRQNPYDFFLDQKGSL